MLTTLLASVICAAPLTLDPVVKSQEDLQQYWRRESSGRLSVRQHDAARAWQALVREHGPIYVSYRFVVEPDGAIRDFEVLDIDPPIVDKQTAQLALSIGRYVPAPGVEPVRVRVELDRVKNWVPGSSASGADSDDK